ncbi:MAG TPA: glycosyltransferase family 2 protein [Polyangiaceae bacterium]
MSASEPFVSVVTPFYNTEPFLPECIESVLAQSYSNFEYVLIDNHSKDRSYEVALEYAKRDARVRVIRTPEFYNQVQNYNFALEQLRPDSRYVKMVQADDWIFPRCLTEMVALAEASPNVGVVSSYELRDTEVIGTGLKPSEKVLSGRDACRLFLLDAICMFGSPTTVMFRSDVVRNRRPFYEQGRPHEDTEAVFEVLSSCDFGFVHQVLSYTRVRADSISGAWSDYTPAAFDRLLLIKRYGERFLTPGEFERALRSAERWVYGTIARQWLRERFGAPRPDFWAHQKRVLDLSGESLEPGRMALHVGAAVLKEALLAPPRVVARMLRRDGGDPRSA